MKPSTLPGRGSTAVRTPVADGPAIRVGTTRKFRKLLLPEKQIRAGGRTLKFDRAYLAGVARAASEGAFPYIPLQVHETHTKDPRYTEGTVSNLVYLQDGPDGNGLYGDIEFADDKGVEILEKSGRKAGVSVSLVENLVRHEDGKDHRWASACQHVLMTTDPHVRQTGGGGWHPIELDHGDVGEVIDLTTTQYEPITEEEPVTAPAETKPETKVENPTPEKVTLEVTPEEAEGLRALLADLKDLSGRGSGEEGARPEGARSDAPNGRAPVSLDRESAEGDDVIELMRSEIEVERQERIELQRELAAARAESEIAQIGQTGLAPSIIEKARPLLELPRGTGAIELSRDARGRVHSVDPTQVIRDVLGEVIELSRRGLGTIELDQESGMHVGGRAEQQRRTELLQAWDEQFPEG